MTNRKTKRYKKLGYAVPCPRCAHAVVPFIDGTDWVCPYCKLVL